MKFLQKYSFNNKQERKKKCFHTKIVKFLSNMKNICYFFFVKVINENICIFRNLQNKNY